MGLPLHSARLAAWTGKAGTPRRKEEKCRRKKSELIGLRLSLLFCERCYKTPERTPYKFKKTKLVSRKPRGKKKTGVKKRVPKIRAILRRARATRPGFEPGIREPKSRVLPITPPGNQRDCKHCGMGPFPSRKKVYRQFFEKATPVGKLQRAEAITQGADI